MMNEKKGRKISLLLMLVLVLAVTSVACGKEKKSVGFDEYDLFEEMVTLFMEADSVSDIKKMDSYMHENTLNALREEREVEEDEYYEQSVESRKKRLESYDVQLGEGWTYSCEREKENDWEITDKAEIAIYCDSVDAEKVDIYKEMRGILKLQSKDGEKTIEYEVILRTFKTDGKWYCEHMGIYDR